MKRNVFVLAATLVFAVACATTDTTMQPMPGAMSDAEVAGIVQVANEGEVSHGQAASQKATTEEVRAFAQMMVSDHTNALDQMRSFLSTNNMSASETTESRNLKSAGQQTMTALNTYSGRAFDREYMRSQVEMHQWLLNALDNTLIPSTRNAGFRTWLQTQRGAVATHLDRARRIQSGL